MRSAAAAALVAGPATGHVLEVLVAQLFSFQANFRLFRTLRVLARRVLGVAHFTILLKKKGLKSNAARTTCQLKSTDLRDPAGVGLVP